MQNLNVVYIGPQSFPIGAATTKRRRYMVDYMNLHNIQSHYLVTAFSRGKSKNPKEGSYGNCTFFDLSQYVSSKNIVAYIREGRRKLKEWYDTKAKNILILHTLVTWNEWLFYKYAQTLGYKIVFDQVETSYLQNETGSFIFRTQVRISEFLSNKAYRECPAFVISTRLLIENQEKFPNRQLCLLPNSTPEIKREPKDDFNVPLLLLYSGTYTPKDGVSDLIDGVILAYNSGVKCRLILLGKGTAQDMKVLDKTKGLDYIEYRGFVSDEELESTIKQCDILCMTRTNSRFANYGFPFKLSEYLATGNLLLATNVGDVSHYVQDKVSALVVEPENPQSIADAIIYVNDNHESSLEIAQTGHEVMMNEFSIEKVGSIFINFLENI